MVGMLKWWFIFICSAVVVTALGMFGLLIKLWTLDVYKASFVVMSSYFACSAFIGWLTWCATYNKKRSPSETYLQVLPEDAYDDVAQWLPEMMTMLGLIGTVIGFMMMMSDFAAVSAAGNIQQQAGKVMGSGSVALANTLVGIASAVLTKIQVLNLGLTKS